MADRSKLLRDILRGRETFGAGWPSESDFKENRVFRPDLADRIHGQLNQYRRCLLCGAPRSGKTTLACLIGWDILEGRWTTFRNVRYIDLTEVRDAEEEIRYVPRLGRNWLLIIDNWHALPDCHDEVLKRLKEEWKDVGVLFVSTRFEGADDPLERVLPITEHVRGEGSAPIDTWSSREAVARGMIQRHLQARMGMKAGDISPQELMQRAAIKNLHFDEEDYEQALTIPSEFKKVRGNLRFLSWRLKAWNPSECHLREVAVGQVLEEIERQFVIPFRDWVGTLQKVAVVAQWELPYRLGSGENAPPGAKELEQGNVMVTVEPGTAWRMDSTDAYLVLRKVWGNSWMDNTITLLKNYLEVHPRETPLAMRSVLMQAMSDTKTKFVIELLQDPPIWEAEKSFIEAQLSDGRGFSGLVNLVGSILRDLPVDDRDEASKRLGIVDKLLTKDVARAAGAGAYYRSLQNALWFLRVLRKDRDRFLEFVTTFLSAYGEDNLCSKLQATSAWKVQRTFLRMVGYFDLRLREKLKSRAQLQPVPPEEKTFSATVFWISTGTVELDSARSKRIATLASMDEDYLVSNLCEKANAVRRMQNLLNSAVWLFPEQAFLFAAAVPRIWTQLEVSRAEARELSFLVANCWFANRDAAQDLVDLLLQSPLHELILSHQAAGLGRLLQVSEKARPGAVHLWCRNEVNYLSQVLVSLSSEEALDELLIALAVFAPETMAQLMDNCPADAKGRLLSGTARYGRWPRCGVLTLANVPWRHVAWGSLPDAGELVSCEPVQLALAIYAVGNAFSPADTRRAVASLAAMSRPPSFLPFHMGRYLLPWKCEEVVSMAKSVLSAGTNPRISALHNLLLATLTLSCIEWPAAERIDPNKQGHRALRTAIHERMLSVVPPEGSGGNRAVPNPYHPFVESVSALTQKMLAPMKDGPLSLARWDDTLREVASPMELDYWRSKLLRSGKVRWSFEAESDPPQVTFCLVADVERDFLYQLADLVSSSP